MAQRLAQLKDWIRQTIGVSSYDLQPASSDASFRRYFRLALPTDELDHFGGRSFIIMDAPPEKENTEPFLRIANMLARMGINVPLVKLADAEQGFLLLTDLGSTQYLTVLNAANADRLYTDALDALLILQQYQPNTADRLPSYDAALLMRELNIFREWYLQNYQGLDLTTAQDEILNNTFHLLCDNALEQPRVCVHRDFHSRNLMLTQRRNPGVLDFQDAVIGPVTYDVVSLLRDCYIEWPREQVESWALTYFHRLIACGVIPDQPDVQLIRWFDWMGMQRHLKAVGIFARLNQRDAKPNYLKDIPRTLSYVLDVAGRYPELNPMHRFLLTLEQTLANNV
jgi:aminoglycoside/choline kinase family phosphotransferase